MNSLTSIFRLSWWGSSLRPAFQAWRAGINLIHVPYKSAGASTIDVAAGQIQSAMSPAPAAMALVKGGRVKILASAGAKHRAHTPRSRKAA